jgi:hypothetical protein
MNTEFFRARLEEVRNNLELTRVDKRRTLENLLERNLTQELKDVLRNNLSLLLQAVSIPFISPFILCVYLLLLLTISHSGK